MNLKETDNQSPMKPQSINKKRKDKVKDKESVSASLFVENMQQNIRVVFARFMPKNKIQFDIINEVGTVENVVVNCFMKEL